MEIVSTIGLITINATLLHQLVAFLVFLFIINRIMFRPLRSVMDERDRLIEEIQSETADAAKELERLNKELTKKESEVRSEAQFVRSEIEAKGAHEAVKILEVTRQEIASVREKTESDVRTYILELRKHLHKESEKLAVTIMEKLLDRGLRP